MLVLPLTLNLLYIFLAHLKPLSTFKNKKISNKKTCCIAGLFSTRIPLHSVPRFQNCMDENRQQTGR